MGVFDSAKIVKINNKEVKSIKTTNGATIYQKPNAIVTGNNLLLGGSTQWLNTTGNVVINWGDGSANTVNNPTTELSHTYNDGKQSHGIVLLGTITSLGERCFFGCTGLTSITIPSSVTSLGERCFQNCTGLTSIVIPNNVTSLGDRCFYGCTGFTSVTIPSGVISLGSYCFYKCTNLTSVTIPSSVTSLESYCFRECYALVSYQLYWTGNNIMTYNSFVMSNNTNTKFYVPKGQKTNYVNKGYPSDKVVERSS